MLENGILVQTVLANVRLQNSVQLFRLSLCKDSYRTTLYRMEHGTTIIFDWFKVIQKV